MRIFKYIGKFIGFIIKQIFAALIFIGVFLSLILFIITIILKKEETKPISIVEKNSYINISLPYEIKEVNSFEMFTKTPNLTMYDLLRTIDYASKDNKIDGIYLELDNINLSFSQIEELQNALMNFKKNNKKIIAYANSVDKNNYLLGSIANRFYMNPSASTDFTLEGFSLSIPYSKKLTDKIGVEFKVVHVGDYKTYGENYVKENISEEFKKSYEKILYSKADYFIKEISKNKKIPLETFRDSYLNGEYLLINSKKALNLGLVDELISFDKIFDKEKMKNRIDLADYLSSIKRNNANDKIAVIVAEGNISNNVDYDNINPTYIEEQFKKALNDRSVKAIVLRINSSGGSALASEIIHQKLLEIKKKKPVYVSISDTAASGGYYIATAGNKIFANENSITGSIGVVTMSFNLKGLFEKVGLNYENLEFGKTLDFSNISQSPEKYELELIEESMISVYEEFKSRVGSGRKIDIETVESLAKGQIYTGIEAKNNKLVDQIGGLNQTISYLAKDLKLNNYEVIVYRKDFNTWDQMTNFSNYLSLDKYFKTFQKLNKGIEFYEEINNKSSLIFPYDIN